MAAVDWDPEQYERFAAERAQPFWDLVDLIHRGAIDRAVDLGCGTGAADGRRPPSASASAT